MGPESMQQCLTDLKSHDGPVIAEQQVDHGVDVMLGGGARTSSSASTRARPWTDGSRGGARHGYDVALDTNDPSGRRRGTELLGLFSPVGMSAEWSGDPAEPGRAGAQRCEQNRRRGTSRALVAMARATLERLEGTRASSPRSRAPTSTPTPLGQPARRSARRWSSIAPCAWSSITRRPTRTRWWSSPPTTATPARSFPLTRRRPACRPASSALRHQRGRAHADRLRHGRSAASSTGTQVRIAAQGPHPRARRDPTRRTCSRR